MGRPRDGDDRVAWLLDHGHFTAALDVLEADRGLRRETHQQARSPYGLCKPLRSSDNKSRNCFRICGHTNQRAVMPDLTWVYEAHIEYLLCASRRRSAT